MGLESTIVLLLSLLLFAALVQSLRRGRSGSRSYQTDRMLRIRAAAGDPEARYRLGMVCLERADEHGAFRWLMKSAEGGNTAAQDAVGMMYELGRGVSKDYGEAAKWYRKAASHGFSDGEVNLGNLYALGRGVRKDYGEALRWLEEAASKGGRQARNSLSWLLATCPDDAIRNGRRAVDVLSPVVNRGERHPILLDTLAAAWAEAGSYDAALKLVREALSKSGPGTGDSLYEQLKKHEASYETGRPWREPPEGISGDREEPDAAILGRPSPPAPENPSVSGENEPGESAEVPGESAEVPGEDRSPVYATEAAASAQDEGPEATPRAVGAASMPSPAEPVASPDGIAGPSDEGTVTPSHVDYIVEKLLVIEQLLRPLKNGEHQVPERGYPGDTILRGKKDAGYVEQGFPRGPTGVGEAPQTARGFADAFAASVVAGSYKDVYAAMDRTFRAAVPEDQMGPMLQQMYESYGGQPVEAEFCADEPGHKVGNGVQARARKFWYTLRGTRYRKGDFLLFMEVLPEGDNFVCPGFFILPDKAFHEK